MIGDSLNVDLSEATETDKLLYCRAVIGELLDLEQQAGKTSLTFIDGLEPIVVPVKQQSDLAAYLPQYKARLKAVLGTL